jgi:hypothetical protein
MAINLRERTETRVIEGVTYRCWPVPFGVGRPLLVRAFKAVAPAFAAAFRSGAGDGGMASALEAIAGSLDDADVAKFAASFGDAAEYEEDDKSIPLVSRNQDLHFAGRYDVFLQWLMFAMEVNGFARFFSTLRDEATPTATTPTASGSPPSS